MVRSEQLETIIFNSKKTKRYIAEQLGITTMSLHKKIHNITEYKASEIEKMRIILGMDKETRDFIFFEDDSEFNSRLERRD